MNTSAISECDDPEFLDTQTPHQLFDEISQLSAQYVREVPGKRRSWPESIRARILALARLGVPPRQVAQKTGISRATIYLWCRPSKRSPKAAPPMKSRFIQLESLVLRQDSPAPVAVLPSSQTPSVSNLLLKLPNGFEFSGIRSVDEALSLFRALEGYRT